MMSLSNSDTPTPSSARAKATPTPPCSSTPAGLAQAKDPNKPEGVRHNLGNTLYSILLHAQCAKINLDNSDLHAAHQNLDNIQRAVQNARDVVDAYLVEDRPSTNNVQPPATQDPAEGAPARAKGT